MRTDRGEKCSLTLPNESKTLGPGQPLSADERAALLARLDSKPTKADWALYDGRLIPAC